MLQEPLPQCGDVGGRAGFGAGQENADPGKLPCQLRLGRESGGKKRKDEHHREAGDGAPCAHISKWFQHCGSTINGSPSTLTVIYFAGRPNASFSGGAEQREVPAAGS